MINEAVLKKLAIMQEEGDEFFIIKDIAYECDEQEVEGEYAAYVQEIEGEAKNEDEDFEPEILSYEDWLEQNYTQVEEYDERYERYLVYTDDEADDAWEDALDSYLEECVLTEIPKQYHSYFDGDSWKTDARQDGRGHSLASYDGHERCQNVEGETFYLYKIN